MIYLRKQFKTFLRSTNPKTNGIIHDRKGGLMSQIDFTNNYKNIRVKSSDGSIITGKINSMSFSRLSDYLKAANEKFIIVLPEEIKGAPKKIAMINTEHIVWLETWDDPFVMP